MTIQQNIWLVRNIKKLSAKGKPCAVGRNFMRKIVGEDAEADLFARYGSEQGGEKVIIFRSVPPEWQALA